MGDIKSTLDLVMEKTSHLSMTSEEKSAEKAKAAAFEILRLFHRNREGRLPQDKMQKELSRLLPPADDHEAALIMLALLQGKAFSEIDEPFVQFLKEAPGLNARPLSEAVAAYQKERQTLLQKETNAVSHRLKNEKGIYGSAVSVNTNKAGEIAEQVKALTQKWQTRLMKAFSTESP